MRPLLAPMLLIAVLWVGCSHGGSQAAAPAAAPSTTVPSDPLVAFETVRTVLQDPRCQNCHPPADRPLQTDRSSVHTMNVQRGPTGNGMPGAECSTCHGRANPPESYGAPQPPGVSSGWHMPPPEMPMVFVGRSSRELCEQLKDPARTAISTVPALLKHVSSDPLVLWGWAPGAGRKPVAVPHAQFVAAFQRWTDAGRPCPQ